MYCEAKKDENVQQFSGDLRRIVENLLQQLHNLSNEIHSPSLLDDDVVPSAAMETIKYLCDDVESVSVQAKNFQMYEDRFSEALSSAMKKRK